MKNTGKKLLFMLGGAFLIGMFAFTFNGNVEDDAPLMPPHTETEKQALKQAEIKAVKAKKKKQQERKPEYTQAAAQYLRSLGHPEFMDIHGPQRKEALKAWFEQNKDNLNQIQAEVNRLNQ